MGGTDTQKAECSLMKKGSSIKRGLLSLYYYSISDIIAQANFQQHFSRKILQKREENQSYKYANIPGLKFLRMFFYSTACFLDGFEGWFIARISSHAVFLKYAKLRQLYAKRA